MAEHAIRKFETGATRDSDLGKPDYEGFLSPAALEYYGRYMHKHRVQPDGNLRDSDNWQKGIPLPQYMKSLLRHVMNLWLRHRSYDVTPASDRDPQNIKEDLAAIIFNAQGYLHEIIKREREMF